MVQISLEFLTEWQVDSKSLTVKLCDFGEAVEMGGVIIEDGLIHGTLVS